MKEEKLDEYNLRIDDVTGKLVIENENDDEAVNLVEQLVSKPGKFQIIDDQNGLVLMDNLDIKNATVVYSDNSSYKTYLQIQFNKEGAQKLKEISNKYVEIKDETEGEENTETNTEENAEEEKETEKKLVSIVFDDDKMMTTYFGEEMTSGLLQIAVGQERTEYEDFLEDYKSAQTLANMINSGILPVTYQLETDNFVKSEWISSKQNLEIAFFVILVIVPAIIYIVKFKKNGGSAWGVSKILTKDDGSYLVLTFQNSVIRFATERYLEVELLLSDTEGLKIPNTSLTEKSFFLIPKEYLTKDESNSSNGVIRRYKNEDGEIVTEFAPVVVAEETKDMYYVAGDKLSAGDKIQKEKSDDIFPLREQESLQGVYNINRGYAVFRKVKILYQNEEYAIIETGTNYGITLYDHIALEASEITENQIIH